MAVYTFFVFCQYICFKSYCFLAPYQVHIAIAQRAEMSYVSLGDYVESIALGTLSDKAYELIRNRILKGDLPLGAPLSRRKLASELGMSFVPVSEALQRLESEGLVESRPRVGTRVRIPTSQDLRERYVIREALEAQAARLFCEKATAQERQNLLAEAQQFEAMLMVSEKEASHPEFQFACQTAHVAFHTRIAESSGCPLLCDLLEKNQLLIFNWVYDVAAGYKMESGRHSELARILTGTDPDIACLAMGQHVRSGMHEIQAAIANRFGGPLSNLNRVPQTGEKLEADSVLSWRLPNAKGIPVS